MSWTNPPTNFALQVLKDGDEHLRKVAAEMLQQVIMGSPVMDGAFRSNNIISINAPDNSAIAGTGNTKPKGSLDQKTFDDGAQKILQAKIGDTIYLQNNLPYAVALENGHSQQTPLGIYSIAYMNTVNKFK